MSYQQIKVYGMDSVLTGINGYEGKTVREIVESDNGNKEIWKLIKRNICFDDEVLSKSRMAREIRDSKAFYEIAHHEGVKQNGTYKKDSASFEEIVESLSKIEVENDEGENTEEQEDEIEEFFSHDDD